jgi:hypothetical protein
VKLEKLEPYRKFLPAAFFIGGFLFDLCTLEEVDSLWTILLQAFYLCTITFILTQMYKEPPSSTHDEVAAQTWRSKLWHKWAHYRIEILHFCIGTLFSCFIIFYFKSASIVVSAGFIVVLAGLFLANEFQRVRQMGFPFKFGILAFCLMAYLAYLVPVVLGQTNALVFTCSICLGILPFVFLFQRARRKSLPAGRQPNRDLLRPPLIVAATFLFLYVSHLIPPVPLSLRFVGVYHNIEKDHGEYILTSYRPWWRFWQHGDQNFAARPGDHVHVFFRMFAPARFTSDVYMVWMYKDPRQGWKQVDRIPIQLHGGRREGFRGYGTKSFYQDGSWQVRVLTPDELEVGRIYFDVAKTDEPVGEVRLERQ